MQGHRTTTIFSLVSKQVQSIEEEMAPHQFCHISLQTPFVKMHHHISNAGYSVDAQYTICNAFQRSQKGHICLVDCAFVFTAKWRIFFFKTFEYNLCDWDAFILRCCISMIYNLW